jgi:hypothetical protein
VNSEKLKIAEPPKADKMVEFEKKKDIICVELKKRESEERGKRWTIKNSNRKMA